MPKTLSIIRVCLFLIIVGCCANAFAQQTQKVYLSGTDKDHTVDWDFRIADGRNSGKRSTIAVPSNWETQGFGNYTYGWEEKNDKEKGFYKYEFKADKDWQN